MTGSYVCQYNETFLDAKSNHAEEQQYKDEMDYGNEDVFDTFQYPDCTLTRRAMSFNVNESHTDYYDTLRKNLRKLRKDSSDLSPSSRRMVTNRYVIGDFDNSGVYSGLRNGKANAVLDQFRNTNSSTCLTQLPRTNQQFSPWRSYEELERSSIQYNRDYFNETTDAYKTHEHNPRIMESLDNGSIGEERPNFRSGRPFKSNFGTSSNTGSLLSGAAWSQLSQPSMEHIVHDIVSFHSDMGSDSHYFSDELEKLSNELIMEGDEDAEETLV